MKTRQTQDGNSISSGLANGNGAVSGTEEYSKRKSQHISWHSPRSYFKPHSPYPVFLFLFKFFFKFPDFPLETLDVLGELGNGLRLLAPTTATPGRTSGPATIAGRERMVKNTVFLNAFAALQTKLPGLLERSRGQCIIWWVYHSSICSLMETPDHSTLLWANVITDFNERMSGYWSRKHISYSLEETNLRLERDSPIVARSPLEYMNHTY